MILAAGDRVEEKAHSTERPGRTGVIQAVLRGGPSPRYRILWDDGHESVFAPAAGSIDKVRRRPGATSALDELSERLDTLEARADQTRHEQRG